MLKAFFKKIFILIKASKLQKNSLVGKNIKYATSSAIVNTGKKENVNIGSHGCYFGIIQAMCGGKVSIGNNFYIGAGTYIQAKEKVEIGDNVIISNNVLIVDNNNHPVEPEERLKMSLVEDYMSDERWTWKYAISAPIVIQDNVWIGKNAVIMKGVTVGKGSVVALGAVVTHNVPPYTVVAGNPAKIVKELIQGDKLNEKV